MRLLGVDFGAARIGIAVAESEPRVVTPRKPLQASGTLAKDAIALAKLAQSEQVDALILGLPYHENANDQGKMQRICQRLAGEIEKHGVRVHLQDESMTSVEAESHLLQADLKASQRKRLRDGEAAAIILERFLDES
jgi:putative Holliday junction resolvase